MKKRSRGRELSAGDTLLAQRLWRRARCHVSTHRLEHKQTAGKSDGPAVLCWDAFMALHGISGLNLVFSTCW